MARLSFLAVVVYAVALASSVAAGPAPGEAVAKRNPLAEALEKRTPTRRGTAATEMTTCASCASCTGGGCTGMCFIPFLFLYLLLIVCIRLHWVFFLSRKWVPKGIVFGKQSPWSKCNNLMISIFRPNHALR